MTVSPSLFATTLIVYHNKSLLSIPILKIFKKFFTPYSELTNIKIGGGAFGLKSEPHHRGMKFGISLHVPDNWGRQLAAGGPAGTRTPDRPVMSRLL